jgi:hypothetical protein
MKRTFGKEIEEETAKLESYRQLRPPEVKPPVPSEQALTVPVPRPATPSKPAPQRKPTQPVAVAKPPPPPSVSRSQPVQVIAPPPVSRSQPVQVIAPPPVSAPVPVQAQPSARSAARSARHHKPNDLGWDDDDLETQIYDGDDSNPKRKSSTRSSLPLQPPVSSSPAISLSGGDPDEGAPSDLSSRAPNGTWGPDAPAADAPLQMSPSGHVVNGIDAVPATFPSGSSNAPSPVLPEPSFDPHARGDAGPGSGGRELSAPNRLVSAASPVVQLPYDPMASFGARITRGRRGTGQGRSILLLVIGGAAVVAITVIVVILLTGGSKVVPPVPPPMAADPSTGFDLYVTPAGVTQWKLDGDPRTDRLPSRIRGIAAGPHTVQIDPPPGFMSQRQQVAVELGKAPRIEITLQPISGIVGMFDSSPPGATVSLIVDGKRQDIGPSPAKAPLDPRNTYRVLFEKPGYVSVNRPVTFSGGLEERIVANLEKAVAEKPPEPPGPPASRVEPRPPPPPPPPRRPVRPTPDRPVPDKAVPDKAAPETAPAPEASPDKATPEPPSADAKDAADPKAKAQGVLVLGSKPPCEIAIDNSPTGLRTPQKEIKLSVGRHRVTLTNSEFGIKETFTVDIKADTPEKAIKDYSDQLPK